MQPSTRSRAVLMALAICLLAVAPAGAATPSGVVTEFPVVTAAAGLGAVAAGPDGNLWFTETSANRIGRVTPAGVVTEFVVAGAPLGIAAGPDGALWFTESGGTPAIGRITTGGAVTVFTAGITAGAGLGAI